MSALSEPTSRVARAGSGAAPDPVARADLLRSRHAVLGGEVHPETARFADRVARAVSDGPLVVVPDLAPAGAEAVGLPAVAAVVCNGSDRVVRVNAGFLRLTGRSAESLDAGEVIGSRLGQIVVGPDGDARLVRVDRSLVRVRVVRWEAGSDLQAVAFVELGEGTGTDPAQRPVDRQRIAELERLARVGTWSFDLTSAALERSDTLLEIYRANGVDPESGAGPIEGEQVSLLCQDLRAGGQPRDSTVELQLPGGRTLSCRAEVDHAADGTPVRLVGVVHDIGAQRQVEQRARCAAQRFVDLFGLNPAGVMLIDGAGRVVAANPAAATLLEAGPEQLRGVPSGVLSATVELDPLGPPPVRPEWLRDVAPGADHGYHLSGVPLRRADGGTVWCELAVSTTVADDGTLQWLVVLTDEGERHRAAELVRTAGRVDELTRLPNRTAALELLDQLLAGPDRDRVAVVCGDLDDFGRVNNSLGHDAGDDLLMAVAARLQRELPNGCTAARLGGDEFVVICADHSEIGGPDGLAGIVADLLRATVTVRGHPVQLTASVGVATSAPGAAGTGEPLSHPVRAADLLRFAEVALHDARLRQQRCAVGVATDAAVGTATQALELEAQLRAAIAEDGLLLEYQPVVGSDGRILSAEALVRWPHPDRGVIPPGEFLPVAQRGGLLRELDLWVLDAAAREASTWLGHAGEPTSVAVNLAGLLPGDVDFLDRVSDVVRDAGLPFDRLVLELVETSLVALPPHALDAMDTLVARGVRFAVDDFGTGHSSLARLRTLPAQTVKVDRAFVAGVSDDPADFAVARAVVDMAKAMGRSTVAEGVETAEQFHVLRGIGIDAYQGWLFSHPLPPSRLRELLAADVLPTPAAGLHP